ncbi:MAG: hypothetical protein [Bacteriophage sp.]|nr:MAG: hypothetical protein [Bacteriophage sp.]
MPTSLAARLLSSSGFPRYRTEESEMEEFMFEMNKTRNFICKVLLMAYAFGMPIAVLAWWI